MARRGVDGGRHGTSTGTSDSHLPILRSPSSRSFLPFFRDLPALRTASRRFKRMSVRYPVVGKRRESTAGCHTSKPAVRGQSLHSRDMCVDEPKLDAYRYDTVPSLQVQRSWCHIRCTVHVIDAVMAGSALSHRRMGAA